MSIKVIIPIEALKTVALFASVEDVRYYLNGINLELRRSEVRLVATNGHIAGMYRVQQDIPDLPHDVVTNVIIPNALLKNLKGSFVEIEIGEQIQHEGYKHPSNERPISINCGGVTVSGKTLDGVYPDYYRVIPRTTSGEMAQFNPHYLAVIEKAYVALHGKPRKDDFINAALMHNGTAPALIQLGDDNFAGVVVPYRNEGSKDAPEWLWPDLPVPLEEQVKEAA
jgi:DNA polymerase-3 subunit beta